MDRVLPGSHRYEHLANHDGYMGGHDHAHHPERFVFVGSNRGHYEESMRGNFHYVGPNQGHYEKERLRPNNTPWRLLVVSCFLVVVAFVVVTIAWKVVFPPPPPFDCEAGLAHSGTGWSEMKKEYCCENEGVACQAGAVEFGLESATEKAVEEEQLVPPWLDVWLGDLSLPMKFTISGVSAMLLGCCCGAAAYLHYLNHYAPKRRSATELELVAEVNKLLKRLGAKTGELAVTLMWDTIDDLDLHLTLPHGLGEISAEKAECQGGVLDLDGNHSLERASTKPIENITWPDYDPKAKNHPPIGEYTIWVKVFARHQFARDSHITVVLSSGEKKDIFHNRVVKDSTEVKICTFKYTGPPERSESLAHDNGHHHRSSDDHHHAGSHHHQHRHKH